MECSCKSQHQCSQNNEGHGNCQQPVYDMAVIEAGACKDWGENYAIAQLTQTVIHKGRIENVENKQLHLMAIY